MLGHSPLQHPSPGAIIQVRMIMDRLMRFGRTNKCERVHTVHHIIHFIQHSTPKKSAKSI